MELVRHRADGGSPPGLGPLPRADVPEGVKAVIEQRLRLLEPTARAVLDIAAIIGRRFDVQVVRAVTETEPDALDVALRSAIRAGLIDGDHRAGLHQTFVHDLVRATLYDAIPPLRRIEGHRRVAEALEQLHLADLPAHVNELAHHFTVAAADGRAEPAIGSIALAGDPAREQSAQADAGAHSPRDIEAHVPQEDTTDP